MRQVHQVVDDQSVVAMEVEVVAIERPAGVRARPEVRDPIRVGQRGVPDPDPHEPMPFDDGIRLGTNALVRPLAANGHLYGSALAVDEEAVIATAHVIAFLDPHGQRQQAVRARVL